MPRILPALFACALLLGAGASPAAEPTLSASQATGTFDIKLTPAPSPTAPVSTLTIDKQFHGDLTASSKGSMLAFRTKVEGSAAYVAMEQITGTLAGHKGGFVLQHSGTMQRGTPEAAITIVPDSGTGELQGISGSMTITIIAGTHHYTLAYRLPQMPSPKQGAKE